MRENGQKMAALLENTHAQKGVKRKVKKRQNLVQNGVNGQKGGKWGKEKA